MPLHPHLASCDATLGCPRPGAQVHQPSNAPSAWVADEATTEAIEHDTLPSFAAAKGLVVKPCRWQTLTTLASSTECLLSCVVMLLRPKYSHTWTRFLQRRPLLYRVVGCRPRWPRWPSCPGPGREVPCAHDMAWCASVLVSRGRVRAESGPLPFVSFVCRHRLILQPIAQQHRLRQISLNNWEEHKRRVLRTFQTSAGLASR